MELITPFDSHLISLFHFSNPQESLTWVKRINMVVCEDRLQSGLHVILRQYVTKAQRVCPPLTQQTVNKCTLKKRKHLSKSPYLHFEYRISPTPFFNDCHLPSLGTIFKNHPLVKDS